jgi:hypothetical protein
MKEGKTLTFIELVDKVDSIQVPILQRDYAQGREEAAEVRRQFLSSIKRALLADNPEQPLDLDFVYGNFEGSGCPSFSVLDGQQRLTTLFLLHWYVAIKEGCLASFQESFTSSGGSKFTYRTRVSASEFFNALVTADDIDLSSGQDAISELIVDKQWFFLSWKSDPTVQACLTMLDAMHQQFFNCDEALYERLTDTQKPCLVFQYLNLESFGLSDELYIKMNARGKPLSDFENFKAWFCSQLEKTPAGKRIEQKLDQQWTDIFWRICQESDSEFDKLYLRFFNLLVFYRACERVQGSFDSLEESWKLWLRRLRLSAGYVPTDDLEKFESFDEENLCRIESILDYFFVNLSNENVLEILKDAVTSNDYVGQTKFYAFVRFIQDAGASGTWTKETEGKLSRWNRVTNNLINNHRIDELSPFILAIRSLSELSVHCGELYELLAESGMEAGFAKEQWEEESLKARLILGDQGWEELLARYERHPYLQGKVGFLLEMATDPDDNSIDQRQFEEVASKTATLLSDDILRSGEFLLERALLAFDDYLVQERGYRYSFCIPNRSTYRERFENWLRVVKKPVFKMLVNAIEGDIKGALTNIIAGANCGGWRQLVIENPEVIRYCSNRLVHKEDNLIYLLSKSTFRGYHAELRTFIFEKNLSKMSEKGELPDEISDYRYVDVYNDDTAYAHVELNNKDIYSIYYEGDGFYAWDDEEENELTLPKVLENLLRTMFPGETVN